MIRYSIYVVDDDDYIREGVAMALNAAYEIEGFSAAEPALDAMCDRPSDLVLLDIGLPGMDGIEALRKMKSLHPQLLVIMITAFEDVETVISAMKLGAYDYVVKPIHMDGLELRIRNALQTIRLRKEVQLLQERYLRECTPCFIGESKTIQDVMRTVEMVSKSPDTPVLILGETGTGKELIANAIHYRSPNFNGPLVTVNCSAIQKELIESELFGYEGGAFTGARPSGKKGLIEEAANGTLFLDEVGDLSQEAQGKLLRFLEGGEYYRVGSTRKLRVQTRVVSATNRNLLEMVGKGLFRQDLYFRLGVVKIELPSLNDRREDILPLAGYFLVEFARKFGKTFTAISPEAESALLGFHWQGNIRELRNFIERGVLMGRGPELTTDALGIEAAESKSVREQGEGRIKGFAPLPCEGIDFPALQEAIERFYIEEAVRMTGGNETKAAQLLNMNHHTFRYRRKRLLE